MTRPERPLVEEFLTRLRTLLADMPKYEIYEYKVENGKSVAFTGAAIERPATASVSVYLDFGNERTLWVTLKESGTRGNKE